jgi:AsmA protein
MMDLDKVLSRFEETQNFNLIDLGAFFIAGPLGTAATKGIGYGSLYSGAHGGRSTINEFVSNWKIKKGIAGSSDCALATQKHRVALKGKLDLVRNRYDNVIMAILNEKGCADFSQKINGPFADPQIGAISTIQSIAGPILNLLSKAKGFIQGGRCEVFYNGSVRHPH